MSVVDNKVEIVGCIIDHKMILCRLASSRLTILKEPMSIPRTVLFKTGLGMGRSPYVSDNF